ncbi:MAG: aminotransferase class I/II-fold pyridoxal phosphate-dependent enzyme [Halocynthiibacter sp.]
MVFPERFSNLPEYAFPRLRGLLDAYAPGNDVVHMSIGEPQHEFPGWVSEVIAAHAQDFRRYPVNDGAPWLLTAISDWIARRYGVPVDPSNEVMALNGTREGLFNAAMALCPETTGDGPAAILIPNPFYQVYAAAAASVGAEPVFVAASEASGNLPDYSALPEDVLKRTTAAYICSPSNPQGAVADRAYWKALIGLAEKYDFRIFADECYAEIYRDMPPPGALEVARAMGADPDRVLIFHSLSKRSNMAGLRSGFVAGGAESIARIKQLRTFGGAPLPIPLQRAAEKLWADEEHVQQNRALYREKYVLADQIFDGIAGYQGPQAGFFLWLPVDDGETAALRAWREAGVRVLPGAYLGRTVNGKNPGQGYIRVALVAPIQEMQRGLIGLRDCLYG